MESSLNAMSIFDYFYRLDRTPRRFAWKILTSSYKLQKQEAVCSGSLEEIDSMGIKKHYIVTSNKMIRYSVLLLFNN